MARLIERGGENRYQMEQKKRKIIKRVTIIVCAVAVTALVAYGVNSYVNKAFNSYRVIKSIKRQDSNTVKYFLCENRFVKYSRDGATGYNNKGETLWNGSYDYKNPAIAACEGYTAVADIGGKEAIVFDGTDSGKTITTVLPILQVKVANQGVTALVLEEKESNIISIYIPTNTGMACALEVPTNVQQDGFPVDIALSNDGQRLVTSYLKILNGVMENNITFYNFGEVGKNMVNNIVGARTFGQNIAPKVEFINNQTVCVYGENSFTLYSMVEKPKEIGKTVEIKKTIKSTFSDNNYIGFVLENYEGTTKYQVVIYDLKGKQIFDKNVNYEYEQIILSGNEIIFYRDLECSILKINGSEKFNYKFDKNIEYIFPINHYDKYILIDETNIEIIALTEEKKK